MKGAIQETGSLYYTNMKQLFKELEEAQLQYDWLITDFVGYPQDEAISRLFENDAVGLTRVSTLLSAQLYHTAAFRLQTLRRIFPGLHCS